MARAKAMDITERQRRLILHTYNRVMGSIFAGQLELAEWVDTIDALQDCATSNTEGLEEWRVSKTGELTFD